MLRNGIVSTVAASRDLLINVDLDPSPPPRPAATAAGFAAVEEARAALAEDLNLNQRLVLEQAFLRVGAAAA